MYYRRSDSDSIDSTSDNIVGNVALRLFPQSRFPTEFFAEKSDSRNDTDLTGLTIDRIRYGINQAYVTKGGASMSVGYERNDQTNITTDTATGERLREDVSDLVKARFNKAFGAHSIVFDASANRVDITNSVDFNETVFSTLRHAYRPSATFASEDMLTYNKNDVTTETSRFENDVIQLNSFGLWRPRTKRPLRLNGTIRALTRTNQNQAVKNEAQTGTGTLGATYEWSQRLLFNFDVGITGAETDDESTTTHFQGANALYNSVVHKLFNLNATWFGQLDLRNTDEDGDQLQEAGAQLGYNLDKFIVSENKHTYALGARQSISTTTDTDDFSTLRLLSNISLGWNRRGTRSNSMARFSISDTRTEASGPDSENLEGEFQIANLQASFDNRISLTSAFRANATLQVSRNYRSNTLGVLTEGNGDWVPTSTIDMTFYKRGLFEVPNLSFYSTLRSVRNSYAPVVGEFEGRVRRDNNQWENRLEYNVGKLQLRAISRLSAVRGEKQNYFLLQARRLIGQL